MGAGSSGGTDSGTAHDLDAGTALADLKKAVASAQTQAGAAIPITSKSKVVEQI